MARMTRMTRMARLYDSHGSHGSLARMARWLALYPNSAAKLTKSEIILVMANYAKNNGPSQDPRRYICSRRNSNYVKILPGKSAFLC